MYVRLSRSSYLLMRQYAACPVALMMTKLTQNAQW